jgi:membrane-associated protein
VTWIGNTVLSLTWPIALIVVFALPALEASTPLGIVVPGELALVLGGVLAHLGRLPLWAIVVAGAAGAVVGDSIGYAAGRRFGDRLLSRLPRPFVRPDRVERAKALVRRLGGRAVFAGRFTAVLRALVPVVAGTARMPYRTFAVYNIAGGVLWATGVAVLGYGAGGAYQAAESTAARAGLILLGAGVVGAAAAAAVHHRRRRHHGRPAPGPRGHRGPGSPRTLSGRPGHGETLR